MRRRLFHTNFLFTIAALIVFAFFSLQPLSRYALIIPAQYDFIPYPPAIINLRATTTTRPRNPEYSNALADDDSDHDHDRVNHHVRHVSSLEYQYSIPSVSVLLADWEVLVIIITTDHKIISFDFGDEEDYLCLFQNNATSPARFSGRLPLTNQIAFKCIMPHSVRRLRPFFQPVVIKPPPPNSQDDEVMWSPMPELYRWNFLVYESFSTENDVLLFVKGLNNRQGINRSPSEFRCVFYYDDSNTVAVRTAVTSSTQEVFRCSHPDITAALISSNDGDGVDEEQRQQFKVSLEIVSDNLVVPSVAYYVPPRRGSASHQEVKKPSRLCASTMVYNAAKFLKEWVMYHSEIGVDRFMLYDNDSNDDLNRVVRELNDEGYDVRRIFWVWPKTQEAGFSHSAVYGKDSCTWMMYVDIDEFVFSPSWSGSSKPSKDMLKSLLPRVPPQSSPSSQHHRWIGQVSIRCNEFGPSNQRSHPVEGVTQGYTCRRWAEQRHKSIVLLDAVDPSLLNAIHHFQLRKNYRTKTLNLDRAVVNHYKYQAWTEFQNKFRRRVSAYVVDWKEKANLGSKDRTPGLGFDPTEPKDWAQKFCEVKDERLKVLTRKWFGSSRTSSDGYNKLAWER